MTRNPPGERDELIFALDLDVRCDPVHTSEKNPEIVELSHILNQLPIHAHRPDQARFRNPNSVYMKLCNFLSLDPKYTGYGLTHVGRADREIWRKFASRRAALQTAARNARRSLARQQT